MCEAIGVDLYNQCITGGCYTLDEKMGQTYIHKECANTLAQRDYKQPQMVIYETDRNDSRPSDTEI